MKKELILQVVGSSKLKFSPGHYCGKAWGYGVYQENWTAKDSHRGADGYSAGGVLDFKDVEKLYKHMLKYKEKNQRAPIEELFK